MTAYELTATIAQIIEDEGGGPGDSIHDFRCTFPAPCDCAGRIAARIVIEVIAPELAAQEPKH